MAKIADLSTEKRAQIEDLHNEEYSQRHGVLQSVTRKEQTRFDIAGKRSGTNMVTLKADDKHLIIIRYKKNPGSGRKQCFWLCSKDKLIYLSRSY